MTDTPWRRVDVVVGLLACVAIALHDHAHVIEGRYYDAFWICNVAALVLGPALIARSATLVFVSFSWLVPGTVVWLVDAWVAGSNILPTSYAVHLGGSAGAIYGVARFGHARWGWVAAVATLVFAVAASRFALPPDANVNAAHAIPAGWDFLGGSRIGFIAVAAGLVGGLCAGAVALSKWISGFEVGGRAPGE